MCLNCHFFIKIKAKLLYLRENVNTMLSRNLLYVYVTYSNKRKVKCALKCLDNVNKIKITSLFSNTDWMSPAGETT